MSDAPDEPRDDTGADRPADEPVDQLGIPMNREPTLDDVRGDGEQHRRLAIGCALLVAALLVAFYLIRAVALG
jgi:hypothetical protein